MYFNGTIVYMEDFEQLLLPYPEEGEVNSEKNIKKDTEPEELVTDIQIETSELSLKQNIETNTSPQKEEVYSIQPSDNYTTIDIKTSGVSIESEADKKMVDKRDKDDAYLIHNILKKRQREGWETNLWGLYSTVKLIDSTITYNRIRTLLNKYCVVDHKRTRKNYYAWNDAYVFYDPKLMNDKEVQNPNKEEGREPKDWWNYLGPIISESDAYFRHEMDEELRKDERYGKEDDEQNN